MLVEELNIAPDIYGWFAGIPALGYLSGSFLSGRLAIKIKLAKLILFGAVLGIGSLIVGIIINLGMIHFTLLSLLAPLIGLMLGIGFMVPTGSSGAMAPFPKLAGSESALLSAFMFAGASILTAIGSHFGIVEPIALFFLLGSVCVLGLILAIILIKIEKA